MNRSDVPLSERTSFTIDEWGALEGFSRSYSYRLIKAGRGPRTYRAGRSHRISREAAAEWRRKKEAETEAA